MNLLNPEVFQVAKNMSRTLGSLMGPVVPAHQPPVRPNLELKNIGLYKKQAERSHVDLATMASRDERLASQDLSELTWTWVERAFPGCTGNPRKAKASLRKALAELSPESFCHSARVAELACRFGRELGLSVEDQDRLRLAGHLHDIGKVAIPSHILNKPGALTQEEYEIVRLHPLVGEMLLERLGLEEILPVVRHHHERWDGKGYPDRQIGEEIPLLARIVALVDSYDAMTGPRSYRQEPLTPQQACTEILKGAGTQFDANLARRFVALVLSETTAEELPAAA